MRFSPFKKKSGHSNEDVSLNITAMADIFTILLVFLLKSFSTGVMQISPSSGLTLPSAQAEEMNLEAIKIEISENAVIVETEPAAALKNFLFATNDLNGDLSSKSLGEVLKKHRQKQIAISKVNTDVKVDARILIIADQKTPYTTVKSVLASAAVQGFTDFKLAVLKEGS